MLGFEVTGPYAGAMMMSLAALFLFIWGVLSGALSGTEKAANGFFEREMENERSAEQRSGEPDAPGTGSASKLAP
ncbi:MAG: hypothetical protein E5X37_33230 [Mesorhizobium sp.]|nr:MAG: hypothetical protein E5X37_33230 [Mesorhizobium sp.]